MLQPISCNGYSIYFNEDGYEKLRQFIQEKNHSKVFILVDENTHIHCLPRFMGNMAEDFTAEIIEIEAGEVYKNIETCSQVWQVLSEMGADRKSLLINLGGGVVTDLGGFVASTFMRGIDFVNIPTSLLAMVDASVGGKTGVDLGPLKNQVGVINVPETLLVDTAFLNTLPPEQMRSGLAEMLKHGLIYDKNYWKEFQNLSALDLNDLDTLIRDSIIIKNNIVMEDPREAGLRKTLNFGHTLGHAIESYFLQNPEKPTLLHGEAIAIGMILETFLSREIEQFPGEKLEQVSSVILSYFPKVTIEENDIGSIISYLKYDKKNTHGNINFVLLRDIGTPSIDVRANNELITRSFTYYKEQESN
ncbi:3-dehydroquinate synthase [Sinomicrobium weinanense]|uniref:3-dehydroquinate synthase n=1 Tax=Sinomicrobium weinanense TaxID=2842200 RepID=A0A926JWD0_9FLAO|nr:3-dehydroquinate synthase [Sinomicrobium weinanense]MBC9798381.1 3-dehydroquinate synthase [Sinomicrobium weinanense]MBU3122149.1 3-dehydroquinate synthase [Sinomicrobium weinanense]